MTDGNNRANPQPLVPAAEANGNGALAQTGYPPFVVGEPASHLPPGLHATPTLSSLAQALRRRWPLAVGLASVFLILFVWPSGYTAQARLQVAARPERPLFDTNQGEDDFLLYKANVAAMIKSPLVLTAALNRPAFADQATPKIKDLS